MRHLLLLPCLLVLCTCIPPPNMPPGYVWITGERVVRLGEASTFEVQASDEDLASVFFRIDWGLGDTTGPWHGPWPSDSWMTVTHIYPDTGTFEVRVMAKDDREAVSEWSSPRKHTVTESGFLPAPDFILPDLEGNQVRVHDLLRDHLVCLVWWDLPLVNAIALLDVLQPIYDSLCDRGLEVLALSVDKSSDETRVRQFVDSKGWTFPVLLDSQQTVRNLYEVVIKPTTHLVSTDTAIVYTYKGFKPASMDTIYPHIVQWLPGP
jgi:peroxiredoxin